MNLRKTLPLLFALAACAPQTESFPAINTPEDLQRFVEQATSCQLQWSKETLPTRKNITHLRKIAKEAGFNTELDLENSLMISPQKAKIKIHGFDAEDIHIFSGDRQVNFFTDLASDKETVLTRLEQSGFAKYPRDDEGWQTIFHVENGTITVIDKCKVDEESCSPGKSATTLGCVWADDETRNSVTAWNQDWPTEETMHASVPTF